MCVFVYVRAFVCDRLEKRDTDDADADAEFRISIYFNTNAIHTYISGFIRINSHQILSLQTPTPCSAVAKAFKFQTHRENEHDTKKIHHD